MEARSLFNLPVRFLGYFLLVFLALFVLRQVPFIGGIFRIPLLGFFLSAAVVSALGARTAQKLAERRRMAREARDLGAVDTPLRRGKLGRLLLSHGRAREAVEHLEVALAADPENVEWSYRLGLALLRTGDGPGAVRHLRDAVERDERHAYGDALLHLGLAELQTGEPEAALSALERLERLEGPTPEQMFHKGRVQKILGRRGEARESFKRLPQLVEEAPGYQKAKARKFALRALWTR